MNTQKLDRLLCERLGIEPVYPALSTTGDGMDLLMRTLVVKEYVFNVYACREHYPRCFRATVDSYPSPWSESAPLALALATCKALGIEVPE